MNTPKSGREAFEALVEKWRGYASEPWADERSEAMLLNCANELEAALAQQPGSAE